MFTVFKEAVINLDGKLKQEMEQSAGLASVSEGPWEPESCLCYCWALWPSIGPRWLQEFDGIVQFALSQPYWDYEDYASGSGESLSLISQGLYPSLNTDFIIGKESRRCVRLYWCIWV